MITALTFLWHDPLYRHASLYRYDCNYVNRLRSMVERHLSLPHQIVCATDDPTGIDPRVQVVELPSEVCALGGYWPKLWAFHPDGAKIFGGRRLLMLDLDIVIAGSIDAIAARPEPFVAWSVVDGKPGFYNTSVVLMDVGAFPEVWTEFDPDRSVAMLRRAGLEALDQDWVSYLINSRGTRWARRGEGIEPFQRIRHSRLPDNARIVCFNGARSPAMPELQKECPWIVEHWR